MLPLPCEAVSGRVAFALLRILSRDQSPFAGPRRRAALPSDARHLEKARAQPGSRSHSGSERQLAPELQGPSRRVRGSARQPAHKPAQGFASSLVFHLSREVLCRRSNPLGAQAQRVAVLEEFRMESAEYGGLLGTSGQCSRAAVSAYGTEYSCRVAWRLAFARAAHGNSRSSGTSNISGGKN